MALLVTVVESGSMRRASRTLGLTPSAVSQQIRQLERETGVTLLRRSTRRLVLTDAGQAFYEGCASMLAAARSAHERLTGLRKACRGAERQCADRFCHHAPDAGPGSAAGGPPGALVAPGGDRRRAGSDAGTHRYRDCDRDDATRHQPRAPAPGGLDEHHRGGSGLSQDARHAANSTGADAA
jgi:molybdenum-dependent DNA-binding transcriptional regulator ModE